MFATNAKNALKISSLRAKMVAPVTILVLSQTLLLAACAHDQIQVDNSMAPVDVAATNQVTPEPESAPSGLATNGDMPSTPASGPAHKRAHHKHGGHKFQIAKHAHKPKNTTSASAVARIEKGLDVNGPDARAAIKGNDALPALAAPAIAELSPTPSLGMTVTGLPGQDFQNWLVWLTAIILSSGALLWFAMRRTTKRAKARSRRLTYN